MEMETATYDLDQFEVFDAVLRIIKGLGWVIESEALETGNIIVSTRGSLRSWGETITIQIFEVGSQTSVSVMSTPKAQLIDWGRSAENEKLILGELDKLFRREG
jgi:hypothetical protein